MDIAKIFTLSLENGLFTSLFVFSFWFILTESKRREKEQMDLYKGLSKSLKETKNALITLGVTVERTDTGQANVSQELTEIRYMIIGIETIVRSQMGYVPRDHEEPRRK